MAAQTKKMNLRGRGPVQAPDDAAAMATDSAASNRENAVGMEATALAALGAMNTFGRTCAARAEDANYLHRKCKHEC